jgi:prevent-host-death family protein
MLTFSALDLQQRTGDIQRAAVHEPVLLTSHGKPRTVVMSANEFRRLKAAAGEPVPPETVEATGTTLRAQKDPLGYDMSDYGLGIDNMISDVMSGRTKAAVKAELEKVRRAYRGGV